jgi:ABC-2 type transport system permease protein
VLIGSYYQGVIGLERLGFEWHLRDFQLGLVSLSGVLYFLSLIILSLYINLVVITRRHWSRGRTDEMSLQFLLRTVGLAAALISVNLIAQTVTATLPTRFDWTRNGLYTLDESTRRTLDKATEINQPVTVQAYVSGAVPRDFVHAKNYFLGLLRQLDRLGGANVDVQVKTVRPYSAEADEARTHGITATASKHEIEGQTIEQDVVLGAYVFGPAGDAVVPSLNAESSIEYELTRAIANTTDKKKRLRVGVLTTDLFFLGPLVREKREEWSFNWALKELSKTYEFKPVSADELKKMVAPPSAKADDQPAEGDSPPAPGDGESPETKPAIPPLPDVLLVAGPSSLPQPALEDLVAYIAQGHPTLILEDPLPFNWTFVSPENLGVLNAPRQPRVSMRSQARPFLTEYFEEKAFGGTPIPLLALLGIEWNNGRAAWHELEPLPGFTANWPPYLQEKWPDYYGAQKAALVFTYPQGTYQPFNKENEISKGLRRLLFVYPGSIAPAKDARTQFSPLVELQPSCGTLEWDDLVFTPDDPNFPGQKVFSEITGGNLTVVSPRPPLRTRDQTLTIAAHLTGTPNAAPAGSSGTTGGPAPSINVVFIADTDFLSEVIPYQQRSLDVPLDNVKLVQNALEVLAGDSEFVRLRNRQANPPSLTRFEALIEKYRLERVQKQQAKEQEILAKLEEEQKKLDEAAKKIGQDQEMDVVSRVQELMKQSSEAQQRFDIQRRRLDRERDQEIGRLKGEELHKITRTEGMVRWLAVGLAPMPAILLGVFVLTTRFLKEKSQIKPERRI